MKKVRTLLTAATVLAVSAWVHPGGAEPPRRWALIVGAGDYREFGDEPGGDLPGAANDARAMRDVLVSRWGFPAAGVRVLVDSAATREGIRRGLTEWLPSVAKPGDLVVFYFSGHGSQVLDQGGDEDDGLDETLCPTDVLRGRGTNDIRDDELGAWLRALPTRNVSVILDACHSGTATRSVLPGVRRKALARAPEAPAATPRPGAGGTGADAAGDGVLEISASEPGQYAVEWVYEDEGGTPRPGGAFTTPLVRYLRQVPAGTSYQEVFRLTRDALRRGNFAQNPQISAGGADRPLFAVAGPAMEEGGPAAPETFRLEPSPLRVGVAGLPAALVSALSPPPGVALVSDPDAPADLALRAEGDALLVVGVDGLLRHRVERAGAAGAAAEVAALLAREQAVRLLASLENPAQPFAVSLGFDGGRSAFRIGETVSLRVRSARDGFLTLVDVDPAGRVTVLFPYFSAPEGRVRAGEEVRFPAPGDAFDLRVEEPAGRGVVRAFVTQRPLDTGGDLSPEGVARALRRATGAAADGPVPTAGWSTAAVLYDFTR